MQHAHKVFDEMCRREEEWLRGEDELGGSWGLVMAAKRVWGRREMGGGIYRVWEGWLNGRRDERRTGLEDDMMAHGAREQRDGARQRGAQGGDSDTRRRDGAAAAHGA